MYQQSRQNDVDRALDGLGFSYLDGVPFRLDPRIENVSNYDFSNVNQLLNRSLPANDGLSQMCTDLIDKMGNLETQVLKQLKALEAEKEAIKEREEEMEARFQLQQQQQQEESATTENEAENGENEDDTETEEPSTASISDVLPQVVPNTNSEKADSSKPVNMDFSEFEAEKDPFEQAELQTINDMQELAAVLQTTATNSFPTTSNPTYSMSSNFPYYQPYYYQQQRPQIPQYFPYNQTQQPPQNSLASQSTSEMKSSKSVGDIMVEITKEAEALEKLKIQKRKNSQTPPPQKALNSDEFWPDIGQKSASILSDLSPSSASICRQISEMGFKIERVVKGCKSLGDDRQKLINFCLLVDKILSSNGRFSPHEVEYVIPIHNLDEENSVKHLKAFHKLEELGFDRVAIHKALIDTKLDHDKALEKLLK